MSSAPLSPVDEVFEIVKETVHSNASRAEILDRIGTVVFRLQRHLLIERLIAVKGSIVQTGPFAGMQFIRSHRGSEFSPKILGSYEAELHEVIRKLPAVFIRRVVNIGCGEGYYAVGLARLLPNVQVIAFDADPIVADSCRSLAQLNNVADRVTVEGVCTPERVRELSGPETLIFCDCEGAEITLLDPDAAPALADSIILVEMHDCYEPGISTRLLHRFRNSHHVQVIEKSGRNPGDFPFLRNLHEFGQALLFCEFRPGPTPWAFLLPRSHR